MCAKNTRGGKRSSELDSVAKALLALLLVRLRTEAIAGGQTHNLFAARRLFELKQDNPIVRGAVWRDFREWLHKLCQIVLPEQLLWLAENLCDVNGDFVWVQRGIERISSDVVTEIWGCIGIISTGRPEEVAGWILGLTWYGRMNELRPAKGGVSIRNYVEEAVAQATTSAVNHARVLIAIEENRSQAQYKDKESGGISKPGNNHQSTFHERIVSLMKKHPTKSHREILGTIDAEEGLDIPNRFKKHEHRGRGMVMVGAYDCTECRRSVEVFMSRMREPLGLPQAPRSRRP